MTKRHFIALADAIRHHNDRNRARYCDTVKTGAHNVPSPDIFTPDQLHTLADFCEAQNPAFKRERWLDYIAGECGPNGGARQ